MQPMTIAHISDLHLSSEHRRENIKNARRLLDYARRCAVDHIIITGDIAADAERRDLELARKIFDGYGLLDRAKLTMVIGNHDIFGGVHTAEDILTFPRRCRTTEYREKVKQFRSSFHELFEGCVFAEEDKTFPFAKVLGDVVLVGANSIAHHSGVKNPIGSNGDVGKRQTRGLEQLLTSELFKGKRKLVLIHHHFSKGEGRSQGTIEGVWGAIERQTMKLRGKRELLELFAKAEVDLVLHGHLHESMQYTRKGIRFLNAGGSSLGRIPGELYINLVNIAGASVETAIHRLPCDSSAKRPILLHPAAAVTSDQAAA